MSAIDQLLAVAPKSHKEVEIEGVKFSLNPISLMAVAKLVRRFPDAMKMLTGEADDLVSSLVKMGPEMIAAIIVAAVDEVGNIAEEAKVAELPDEMQLEILAEILDVTMPEGLEAFLGKLMPFLERIGMTLERS